MLVRAQVSCSQTLQVGFVEGMEFQELFPLNEKWEDSVAPQTGELWSFSHSGTQRAIHLRGGSTFVRSYAYAHLWRKPGVEAFSEQDANVAEACGSRNHGETSNRACLGGVAAHTLCPIGTETVR